MKDLHYEDKRTGFTTGDMLGAISNVLDYLERIRLLTDNQTIDYVIQMMLVGPGYLQRIDEPYWARHRYLDSSMWPRYPVEDKSQFSSIVTSMYHDILGFVGQDVSYSLEIDFPEFKVEG